MNLNGKYILINKNNVNSTFEYLYKNGYKHRFYTIEELLGVVLKTFKSREFCYICVYTYDYHSLDWWYVSDPTNSVYLNANFILRESKLKRILK